MDQVIKSSLTKFDRALIHTFLSHGALDSDSLQGMSGKENIKNNGGSQLRLRTIKLSIKGRFDSINSTFVLLCRLLNYNTKRPNVLQVIQRMRSSAILENVSPLKGPKNFRLTVVSGRL